MNPKITPSRSLWILACLFVVTSSAACSFDASGLSEKTACRGDSDCAPSLMCACDQCMEPAAVALLCDPYAEQDAGGTGGTDVSLEDTGPDEDISSPSDTSDEPDVQEPQDTGEDVRNDASEDVQPDTTEDVSPDITEDVPEDTGPAQNVCGGSNPLSNTPGDACGSCGGVWVCAGTDEVVCTDPGENACGGCELLDEVPGDACGSCPGGRVVCDGVNATVCEGGEANACGSCFELPGQPGEACGLCGDGAWECGEDNTLFCAGSGLNVCGGCEELVGRIGDPCGTCSTGILGCSADGNAFECSVENDANACGGCETLPEESPIGESCGECGTGTWVCDGSNGVRCDGGERNPCGGCTPLDAAPGDACGCDDADEQWACNGTDALVCEDNVGLPASPIDLGTRNQWSDARDWTNTLHDTQDEDWFILEMRDRVGDGLDPVMHLDSATDMTICAYMRRIEFNLDGADPSCGQGSFTDSYGGLPGCCSEQVNGAGKERIKFSDIDSGTELDHHQILIRIFTQSDQSSCNPYSLWIDP